MDLCACVSEERRDGEGAGLQRTYAKAKERKGVTLNL